MSEIIWRIIRIVLPIICGIVLGSIFQKIRYRRMYRDLGPRCNEIKEAEDEDI